MLKFKNMGCSLNKAICIVHSHIERVGLKIQKCFKNYIFLGIYLYIHYSDKWNLNLILFHNKLDYKILLQFYKHIFFPK